MLNSPKTPLWLIKLFYFEYWTWWKFYMPLTPYYLYLSAKCRSFAFFTNVNPCLENSGFFGTDKSDLLNKIDEKYLPKTQLIEQNTDLPKIIQAGGWVFPLIAKPNQGERGTNVAKIQNFDELLAYQKLGFTFLIQEYIEYPIELAVLYYRIPNSEHGRVSSVTGKEFLAVTGDGKSSILDLMKKSTRARFQIDTFKKRLGQKMNEVPKQNQKLVLEPIGNHCRGTMFLDYNQLINKDLIKVFDEICKPIEGFYYGRFDLKVASIADLYKGKNIKILELNGVNADAAHIFDPNYKLLTAYKDVMAHWAVIGRISRLNRLAGYNPTPVNIIWQKLKSHFIK